MEHTKEGMGPSRECKKEKIREKEENCNTLSRSMTQKWNEGAMDVKSADMYTGRQYTWSVALAGKKRSLG